MSELRFDDRVAVITGAGRGLGRAYAELLAAKGAKVVVNDIGGSLKGDGPDAGPAEEAVEAIKATGGEAMACTDSVATPEGGRAIIEAAMEAYGRIDILIHNAGNVRRAPLSEMSDEDFNAVLDVHLRGAFHVVRPAFPLMQKAGYGRIVLTSSDVGLYGNTDTVNYSVSKSGTLGLVNVAAIEGAAHGVKANAILPAAITRMAEGVDTSAFPPMPPERVAPSVGWLAHETCSITGEYLLSVGGRIARAYVAETRGVFQKEWTIEDVGAQIDSIRNKNDTVTFDVVPTGHFDHLRYSMGMIKEGGG